ncbi:cysteine desulfurase family protein [Rhodoplanes sp. TEM]|uniref:Cysteine desulfurase n=1 Tax=Rhodoplanes tepidamans TaxID=200616 RepID=A0ABT5J959_RHOTP|nr:MULTISPECIES: cysteine desulfurase family protein [Rhodoplanes]MDC7786180.1 cysteine desulfurase family protein [Rhodoplanes tepidamans]MDC7982847.1 cysteine desulfurase family protein [Rhodoplanes sp. TEM]MDQ0357155.1 cysteine desulfurase [Rhodoplanes tepidamans]
MIPVYLDHNATTPIDEDVLAVMLPYLRERFGNPSSSHPPGRRAREAVETARAEVAGLIGAAPDEIVFTSGGTEASNTAIRGAAAAREGRRGIVTTVLEHPATDECCRLLERAGHPVRRVAARADGRVAADDVIAALDDTVALVTLIHAQNEIGTLQPVDEIARAARARGVWVHADAAQSLGKVPVDVDALGVDLLTIAGHKLYAPKGIGALYVRGGIALPPLLAGAGQEHGMRPGTENVAFIVALGAACRIAARKLDRDAVRIGALAGQLLVRLQRAVPGLALTGHPDQRLPNTLNLLFSGVSGRALLEACPHVLASTGSACHAGSEEPSAVLLALGIDRAAALGAVRLSLGRATTATDVEAAADHLAAAWRRLRAAAEAAPRLSGAPT